jgi:hypothetical protein
MTLAWNELVFQSPYLAVVKAKQLLQEGKITEVDQILENLVESMGRSEKRAVSSQLTGLMLHIIVNLKNVVLVGLFLFGQQDEKLPIVRRKCQVSIKSF